MWQKRLLLLVTTLAASLYVSHGCTIDGHPLLWVPLQRDVLDTHIGVIFSGAAQNIDSMVIDYTEGLNGGPYVEVIIQDSMFIVYTNELFRDYEKNEIRTSIHLTAQLSCTGSSNPTNLGIQIEVIDTNNNSPEFIPNVIDFTLTPPLPPGFQITGCVNEILVRDIDLTTYRINFAIDDGNPDFEIEFDEASYVPFSKEFRAILKTTALIRNIPDTIELRISATDVDETEGPARTEYATVRLHGDSEFELPIEPVFSEALYLANYTASNEVVLQEPISLQQGYHASMEFSLDGEHSESFELSRNVNELTIIVTTPLDTDTLRAGPIILIVRAERELTSGATTTVFIQPPEVVELEFEQLNYEGSIVDNTMPPVQLILRQGYADVVSTSILGDHNSAFAVNLQGNAITLTLTSLEQNVINENNFINLQVVASTDHSTATAVVTLDIVKDDNVTPAFERAVYNGVYATETGLDLEAIILLQGYDETVVFDLDGDHRDYFQLNNDGPVVTLTSSALPPEVLREQRVLLTVHATKPRTVGANTAVSITLPAVAGLEFDEASYEGVIEDNTMQPVELFLIQGYQDVVSVSVLGDHNSSFAATIEGNVITLTLTSLEQNVINENNFIILQVVASTDHSTATAVVTLEVVKDDNVTPAFERAVYNGVYATETGLDLEAIVLLQGFDETVTFDLDGDHRDYFQLNNDGPVVTLTSSSLPPEVLREQRVLLTVHATKPRTVGANTAVSIALPAVADLEFEQANYEGIIEDNTMQPLQLVLSQGYEDAVSVNVLGDHNSSFAATIVGNMITLTLTSLAQNVINENNFINLQVVASTDHSTATAVVTLDIVKDDNVTPAFERAVYNGVYATETGLDLEAIILLQGFDETVTFDLDGEHRAYFQLNNDGPVVTLTSSSLPPEVLREQRVLLTVHATKPRTVGANTAVSITLPAARELGFESPTYTGTLQDGILDIPPIVLSVGYDENVQFDISGDYSTFFEAVNIQNQVTIIRTSEPLPDSVILDYNFLTLTLIATGQHALTTSSTILLEIIKQDITTPVFSERVYYNTYTGTSDFVIENILLTQGYDSSVSFRLDGVHSEYFVISSDAGNNVVVSQRNPIPEELIFNEKVLIFYILADKPLTVGANAVIAIKFPTELTDLSVMSFAQNTYVGSLDDNQFNLANIVLETGFAPGTGFDLTGELRPYFTLTTTDNVVTISMINTPTPEALADNMFIVLELEATRDRAVPVSTSIIIEVVQRDVEPPVFTQTYYRGVYTELSDVIWEDTISLSQGFDETVTFDLEGELSTWFSVHQDGMEVNIEINEPLPQTVLDYHNQLLFTVVAIKPGSIDARAAISIDLPREAPEDLVILRFAQRSYTGSIDNGALQLPPLSILGDIDSAQPLQVVIIGEYRDYFEWSQESNNIQIQLIEGTPPAIFEENIFVTLDIEASYPGAIGASTTIVIEIIKETRAVNPVFEQAYYIGEYSEQDGLQFDHTIRLIDGFDQFVSFTLAGDDYQWFELENIGENSLSLRFRDDVVPNFDDRTHLIFSVIANKPDSVNGHAAIIIALSDLNLSRPLRFSQNYYTGTIQNNALTLETIHLEEGYSSDIIVFFEGEYVQYFQLTHDDGLFVIQLNEPELPSDVVEANNMVILTIEVEIDNTKTHTTVIVELIKDEATPLAFDETYYVGSYSESSVFVWETPIILSSGFHPSVQISLDGEYSSSFGWNLIENTIFITLTEPIPSHLLANNQHIQFIILAQAPNGMTARSTIIITIIDETTTLGFERNYYLGDIANNVVNIEPIILTEGHTDNVSFELVGDLESYFDINQAGATVTILLENHIPEQNIPPNGIIILELQASAPETQPAFATVVFEVVREDMSLVELVFSETYYTGQYTEPGSLTMNSTIMLAEGYDDSVEFELEGESSTWFTMVRSGNSVSLTVSSPIPPPVVGSNHKLIFTVSAQKPTSMTARSTIVISLIDDFADDLVLGFEHLSYLGSIENNVANIAPITLREGFTPDVTFTLHGDLEPFFDINQAGATVTIVLENLIPEQNIPPNGIIILELQASAPETQPAFATVVFEVVREDMSLVELVFSETYYTGQYTEPGSLTMNSTIMLAEGYDDSVEFELEGESSTWFTMVRSGNSVSLTVSSPIPPPVVGSNHKLIFTVSAQKPTSMTARSTIVISLIDDFADDLVLGFEHLSYLGSIENNVANIAPITLREGFTPDVTFTLHGDLEPFFDINQAGATVTIVLENLIPEQNIPPNGIIILELQASAPETQPAFATVVFEVVREDMSLVELVFSETYYTGQYTEPGSLTMNSTIMLAEGYDDSVEFELEGESSTWFTMVRSGNSVSLTVSSPIPPPVVGSNHKLIFTVSAQKPTSMTARSTIVISLIDDFADDLVLGFEHLSYLGSIENNVANIAPITLREGFTPDVTFTLHGDLEPFFDINQAGATVTIVLENLIPEQNIPPNGIIILELQASAPETQPAFATVVFEVVREDMSLVELVFSETYYTGQYTEPGSLTMNSTIMLAEGYDDSVEFELEGESSTWFTMVRSGNSVSLTVSSPIPPPVVGSNHKLIFTVSAQKPTSMTARSTIVISLIDDFADDLVLGFEHLSYLGSIENNVANIAPITLREGFTPDVTFTLHGDLEPFFDINQAGATVTIVLENLIPEQNIPPNGIIILELQASAPETQPAFATVVFEVVREDMSLVELVFSETYYTGQYTEPGSLTMNSTIMLAEGYDDSVEFELEGESSTWFTMVRSGNSVSLTVSSPIPPPVVGSNHKLIFTVSAQKPTSMTARSTIVISLIDDFADDLVLGFEHLSYLGSIENNVANIAPITLREGFTPDVTFTLHGDLEPFFDINQAGATVTIVLENHIPEQNIPPNGIIILELQASAPETQPAFATVVFEVVREDMSLVELVFSETYYTGQYTEPGSLTMNSTIMLAEGYDDSVEFELEGESSTWFTMVRSGNSVSLTVSSPIPPPVVGSNHKLIFTVSAQKPTSMTARSTIVISLIDDFADDLVLGFEHLSYLGSIENNVANIAPITLREGFTPDVTFTLHGDLEPFFDINQAGATVTIVLENHIPEQNIPPNGIIILELQASAPETQPAFATVVFEVVREDMSLVELVFSETYYTGQYTEPGSMTMNSTIMLAEGYDDSVEFELEGESSTWFTMVISGNFVSLTVNNPIPPAVIGNNHKLIFIISAQKPTSITARATIIISLNNDQPSDSADFDSVLYQGIIQAGVVQHGPIIISGYDGTNILLNGDFSELFVASNTEGVVLVSELQPVTLGDDVPYVALELRTSTGVSAVLLLDVNHSEGPPLPTVTFSTPSYVLRVDIAHTGWVGQVQATADNGEPITYSLLLDDAHLLQRLSIDSEGNLHLSAPANSGVHSFQAIATTAFSQVTGSAPVHMTVDIITECGDDFVLPPLLVINRDEEEPHRDLVLLDEAQFPGCRYTMTNRWPINQPWLYVDDTGLHASTIDREDESIAYMALSQVQVQLRLECDSDNNVTRSKRSLDTRLDWLGPYDYGNNRWILTDNITFNSRQTLVNLIVNDINDHHPIFVGKENEPVIVGYPVPELEERVLPRALIELKATDADVGENAAIRYWSAEVNLAISSTTGFVHVLHNTRLEDNSGLLVYATDRNGEGLTGSLELKVKLLNVSHIAVVTVRNAFLDDERNVLEEISAAVGYEVKALRSSIIPEHHELIEANSINERQELTTAIPPGTLPPPPSMQIYVYGLFEQEPVEVDQLTEDINSNAVTTVSIASTISLEDHLDALEICNNTGLLVATIVLGVLLFILIVAVAVWFFLQWRKKVNYKRFSDTNSLESPNEMIAQPKPEPVTKPRLNIEELRRSEKRLQELLDAPVDNVTVEPMTSTQAAPTESIINISMPDPQVPIIIQSIDKLKDADDDSEDEDEYGERQKSRRKSVVTFNENVEKIIHVEDAPEDDSNYEVFRL